ncbi:MAG TPA: endonuclease/exonuclease/phosphatase family protein [Candidatus Binataceae bacterium]|nr:endonuclease/exonuclease/phosphatase family protein [Candidatus Binataceae bacterium]
MARPAIYQQHAIVRFDPIVVNRPSHGCRFPIRVAVFNAKGGAHLSQIAAHLKRPPLAGAEIILLCEAGWRVRRSARREFARELAEALGMSFAFGAVWGIPPRDGGPFTRFVGNAILSSEPLEEVRVVQMPRYPRRDFSHIPGAPNGVIANIAIEGMTVTVICAHLESRASPEFRAGQMKMVAEAIPARRPAIIGGDFNTTTIEIGVNHVPFGMARALTLNRRRRHAPRSHEPVFDLLEECGFDFAGANVPEVPTFTFSRIIPHVLRPKLDWIAQRGLAIVPGSAAVVAARNGTWSPRFSDHDFVTCQIRPR